MISCICILQYGHCCDCYFLLLITYLFNKGRHVLHIVIDKEKYRGEIAVMPFYEPREETSSLT